MWPEENKEVFIYLNPESPNVNIFLCFALSPYLSGRALALALCLPLSHSPCCGKQAAMWQAALWKGPRDMVRSRALSFLTQEKGKPANIHELGNGSFSPMAWPTELVHTLSESVQAAVIKYHRLGDL